MSDPSRRHPHALFALIALAVCEPFAFYGLRAYLVIHLSSLMTMAEVGAAYGLFTAVSSWVALLAGVAVDVGGARRMAIAGGALLAGGLFAMTIPGSAALTVALGLVVAGKGLLEIGLLVMLADLYAPSDDRRDAGFTLFWLGTNAGAFLGPLGVGYLGQRVGSAAAFTAAGLVALASAVGLALWREAARDRVPAVPAAPGSSAGRAFALLAVLMLVRSTIGVAIDLLEPASSWLAGDLERRAPSPTWLIVSALSVLPLGLLASWLWLHLGRRQPSSPAKLLIGALVAAAGALVILALAGADPAIARRVEPGLLLWTVADLFTWPIALAMVSRMAPPRLRGTSLGLLTVGVGCVARLVEEPARFALVDATPGAIIAAPPAAILVAGLLGYALLALLGATRR